MYLTTMLCLISGIIQEIYIICVINCVLVKKCNPRIKIIGSFGILAIFYLLAGIALAIHKRYIPMVWMNIALLVGLNIVIYIVYEGNIVKKLLAFIFPHAIFTSTELLINQIGKQIILSNSITKSLKGLEAIGIFLVKQSILLIIFLILYYECRKLQDHYKNAAIKYSRTISNIIVFYFTSISVLYFYFVPSTRNNKLAYFVVIFGITFVLYMVIHLMINWEIGKNLEELKAIQNQQRSYYNALQDNIDRTRKFRHDIASHINMVQVLKEENKVDFSERIKRDQESNYKVLAVLFDYYREKTKANHINMEIEDFLNDGIIISEYDLVTVCKNLLENAWEACENDNETVEKYINICLKEIDFFLYITVENSKATYQKVDKGGTTKEDKELHGLGMKIVSGICQHYHGKMEYIEEDKQFLVKVKLQNRNIRGV